MYGTFQTFIGENENQMTSAGGKLTCALMLVSSTLFLVRLEMVKA